MNKKSTLDSTRYCVRRGFPARGCAGLLRGYLLYDVVICLSESVLAAGTCFFFQRAVEALLRREKLATLNGKDVSCLIIAYALLVMALGSFFHWRCLHRAGCGGSDNSAGVKVRPGIRRRHCRSDSRNCDGNFGRRFFLLAAAYGFGGMLAGMFAELGSVVQALVFVVVNGLTALIMGERISGIQRFV